jgi:serine/threonine protein kinase
MVDGDAVGTLVDPRIGRLLGGRYRLGARCGSGSMGVVYEGVHEGLGRRVAVKWLHPHLAASADFVVRFMTEARLASRLAHPNVVRVHDFGTEETNDGPLVYLVMEFCSGRQLGELLAQEARFSLARVGAIMAQVLSALAEVHDHGIVHRDVKPENVILEAGPRGIEVVKLIDFGIAETKASERRPAAGVVGTPAYVSPEVIRGEEADHQADLYAAGSMLFELVTGKPLFEGDTVNAILEQHLAPSRPDPRSVAPERAIPEELAAVCLRAVAFESSERFEDADAFADALAAVLVAPSTTPPLGRQAATKVAEPPSEPAHRPPLQSAPQVRQGSPIGRYSLSPDDRPSGEHLASSGNNPTFWMLQELEREAASAMTRRRWSQAIEKLRRGLDAAVELVRSGDREIGAAAHRTFGRRMAEALRKDNRALEAIDVLRSALVHAPGAELARALLLEELGLNAALLGRTNDAIGAWLDAAEVARACNNRAVEQRLLRRIAGDEHS